MQRCHWVTQDPLYIEYHDREWGVAQRDNRALFEMLCLEGQQAGLSWLTVLKKRENYRRAFRHFDPITVAQIDEPQLELLLMDSGLIRHRGKLAAIITNARAYLQMERNHEDFSSFIWQFVNHLPQINHVHNASDLQSQTDASIALSKGLKKRGFQFVGPVICYSFMQACGLVNDHLIHCYCHPDNLS